MNGLRSLLAAGSCLSLIVACGSVSTGPDASTNDGEDADVAVDAPTPDAPTPDAGCLVGEVRCNGSCIDPEIDGTNCGASGDCVGVNAGSECGVDSPVGDSCVVGACVGDRELIVNGDFATGDLTSWGTSNNPVNDNDIDVVWIVATEQASNGTSNGPSAKVLIQDFTVPASLQSAEFSLSFFQAPDTALDPANVQVIEKLGSGAGDKNAFRIDLINPALDVYYAPILYELYIPDMAVGTAGMLQSVTINDAALLTVLQSYEGMSLRLRIAQVESTFPWSCLVDDVSMLVVGE